MWFRWMLCFVLMAAGAAADGPPGVAELAADSGVRVTWYGVTTLKFEDADTAILIDGFFSRPEFESLEDMASPDVAQIKQKIQEANLKNLAAIIPVHSHFDHAMDVGEVARRTGAVVIGSESTANIARGGGVRESNIRVVRDEGRFAFGDFAVTLVRSAHAPLVNGGPPIPGIIEAPIKPPVRIGDWKEGGSYSIFIEHPGGTALVQGSAGYIPGRLQGRSADVVMLGTGGLGTLGSEHASEYFAEMIGATGARCVIPIHWDDFMRPFGDIVFNGTQEEFDWLRAYAESITPPVGIGVLPFVRAVDVYTAACGR